MAPLQGDPVVSFYRVSNREMAATFDSDPCVDRTVGGARGLILNYVTQKRRRSPPALSAS